jgi:hypothetical protein
MGGNAIQGARRVPRSEYFELCEELQGHFPELKMKTVKAYRQKKDFGDIDVVVQKVNGLNIPELVKTRLNPANVYDNNMFFSFEYKGVQVDFIQMSEQDFQPALAYFHWNDVSNFIGRTARSINFKYGHEGLMYEKHVSDHFKVSVVVSRDTEKCLEFLGYNYNRWLNGFDTEEEIFEYAASSPLFNALYFSLDEQAHNDRVRNRKRKMYQKMLAYIEANGFEPKEKLTQEERDVHYNRAREVFGDAFHNEVVSAIEKYEQSVEFKKHFNGEIVSEITGLTGKKLGHFMQSFFLYPNNKEVFMHTVMTEPLEDRDAMVKDRILANMFMYWAQAALPETFDLKVFSEDTLVGYIYGGDQIHRIDDKRYYVWGPFVNGKVTCMGAKLIDFYSKD